MRLGREIQCTEWSMVQRKVALGLLAVNFNVKPNEEEKWHWVVYDVQNIGAPIFDPKSPISRNWNTKTRLFSYFHVYCEA